MCGRIVCRDYTFLGEYIFVVLFKMFLKKFESFLNTYPKTVITLTFILIALIRITGPSDMHQGDQSKQADYVVDIVVNGNWWVHHHEGDVIASKPPLYNWLAAPVVALVGGPNDLALKWPSLLSGFLTLFLVWDIGRRLSKPRVGLYGAIFLATVAMFVKQTYFARTDMMVTFFIVAQFWAMVRWVLSDLSERKWLVYFWLAGGLGIITKGPLAIAIPHMGMALWWIWEGSFRKRYVRLGYLWGIPLLLAPLAFWVGGIVIFEGMDVLKAGYERWVVTETLDRIDPNSTPGETRNFLYYSWHMLSRSFPWSISAVAGLFFMPWKRFRKDYDKNFRLLVIAGAWLITAFIFFSIFPSKRIVRIFPIIPALCLLSSWVMVNKHFKFRGVMIACLFFGTLIGLYVDRHWISEPAKNLDAQYSEALAGELRGYVKEYGSSVVVLEGSVYPLRYWLMQPEGARSVEEVLAMTLKNTYVIGPLGDIQELKARRGGKDLQDLNVPSEGVRERLSILYFR